MRRLVAFSALAVACSSSSASSPAPPTVTPEADAGITADGDVSDAPPQGPPSSHGAGGLTCTRREDLGNGRTACVATVGSVELKIVEPASGTGPLRAGLYLHGDGAGAHKSGSVLKAMLPWADAKHGLGVSALAPNGCAWWQTPTHDCNATTNDPDTGAESSKALAAALTALFAAYDVRTDALDYYGSSGGSIFLTDQWLPLHAGEYPGVFALMCGGSTPGHAYAWDTNDAALRGKSPLFFTYGDQDFLVDDILDAMTSFKAKSFSVTEKVIPGATHCAFDAHAEAIGLWQ